MNVDLKSLLNFEPSIVPQTATADVTGVAVDTQGYNSAVVFGFMDGTAAGAFFAYECDTSGGTYTEVAAANVITSDGTNGTAAVSSDIVTIGVRYPKRYLKVFWDQTTGGQIAAGVVLGNASVTPTGTNS